MNTPEINDGGPAFPQTLDVTGNLTADSPGMFLRDWFAGQALKGLIGTLSSELAQGQLAKEMQINGIHERRVEWQLAKNAYDYADAMLAQRNKK